MPLKSFKLHVNDPLWVTPEFKKLIKLITPESTHKENKNDSANFATSLIVNAKCSGADTTPRECEPHEC
jgi:hypothetical protein